MLTNETLKKYLEALASESPTPGGGSAAAAVGAQAAGLVSMAAKIFGDKEVAKKAERLMGVLANLIDEDAKAYDGVVLACRLPKGTEEEKGVRKEAIQKALKRAAEVPLQTARYAYEVLKLAEILVPEVKPGTVSDVGSGAAQAEASIKSALFNVAINLPSIKDEEFKKEIKRGIEKVADYLAKAERIYKVTQEKIGNH